MNDFIEYLVFYWLIFRISNTSINNPGLPPLEEHHEEHLEGNNLDSLQPVEMGQPISDPPMFLDDLNQPPAAPSNSQEGMEGRGEIVHVSFNGKIFSLFVLQHFIYNNGMILVKL